DYDVWETWFNSADSKNVRITLGARKWIGPCKLTRLNITGQRGQRVALDIAIDTDGKMVLQP
ncbi:hypothetical protein, partial [Klebsiella pneumoniae]|uniref:hypothetical protein n=1 Tax=Klebsiella pneumoniae TaxID=573 RepID=UPI001953CB76